MAVAEEPGGLNDAPAAGGAGVGAAAKKTAAERMAQYRERAREPRIRNVLLAIGIAAVIAVMVGVWMWTQKAEYKVLFSGFSDKDGGAIVTQLESMNVPHKFSDGGGAILVPSDMVHDLRLKLAAQGLPKASGVGFEVMENQKIGASQFLEQVNFQRALEGELGRTIQSMGSIQNARVHLAMQKASVFVRDQQKPTASVMLTLHHGRSLDRAQVNAVVHLVASSVPGLVAANVTVVDQNGELLSSPQDKDKLDDKLDAKQMQFVQELQKSIVKRIESILVPVLGDKNFRAEAAVEVDFSKSEQAEEIYKPNQAPNAPSIRSQQSSETQKMGPDASGGIPGAVTNQPPVPPTAPLVQQNPGQPQLAPPGQRVFTPVGQGGAKGTPLEGRKDSVINYEVDKTLRYTQKSKGEIKRVTVAVAVNYKQGKDEAGKDALVPLTDAEKEQVAGLIREAMGFNSLRGDSLSVLNTRFVPVVDTTPPIWKRPETFAVAKDVGKYVLMAAVLLFLYMAFLKPMIYKISGREEADRKKKAAGEDGRGASDEALRRMSAREPVGDADTMVSLGRGVSAEEEAYRHLLELAKKMTQENPKIVANIVLEWLGND